MAARIPIILLLLLAATALTGVLSELYTDDCIVGGLMDLENVGSNKLVQSLGKFAVENYNRNQLEKNKAPPTTLLSFSHVISAQFQEVEGTAYYLKIAVEDSHHARKVFDAVVVERVWLESKEVLSFTSSAH